MKATDKNKGTLKLAATVCFAVAMFVFWRYFYSCALAYHEQMQLFLWNSDYLTERIAEPGGVARYLAEMLVQYYNNLGLGALLIASLMAAMQQLTWMILRRWGAGDSMRNYLLSFATPVVIWILMGDKDVMTTFPVAVTLALGMMVLAPRKGVMSFFYALLVAVAGYWMLGPIGIVAAVCIAALGYIGSAGRLGPSLALLTVAVAGLLFMSAGFRALPYPVQRIVRGIDYYRDPTVCMPREWYTSDIYEQLEYSMLVRRQDWKGILAKAAGTDPEAMASLAAVRLAQWKTGRIGNEDIRDFITVYQKLDHPINICMKSDVYFHLYMVNASRRYAFEFKQLIGNNNQSGRILKRLAETELVSGHYQLARKYLYILRDAPFYRRWAEETLPLTYDRRLLDAHPVYGVLSRSFPEKDHLSLAGEGPSVITSAFCCFSTRSFLKRA